MGRNGMSPFSINDVGTVADWVNRYIKSDMVESLPDDVIDQTVERFQSVPDGCSKSILYKSNDI